MENEAGYEEVVSVFPDPILELHTTRSWDFLGSYYSTNNYNYHASSNYDVIIGVIDTGYVIFIKYNYFLKLLGAQKN